MAFSINLLRPQSPRADPPNHLESYDSSSSTDSEDTARHTRSRAAFVPSTSATGSSDSPRSTVFLFPPTRPIGRSPVSSTASSTPVPSRSTSPLPQFYPPNHSSSCPSDTDSEPHSPLMRGSPNFHPWWRDNRRGWWSTSRRRRKRSGYVARTLKRWMRRVLRHPFFPSQPITIVLTLILLSVFAIFLTLLLIYILNPDKEPLPWRAYCSIPSLAPPHELSAPFSPHIYPEIIPGQLLTPFPPPNFDSLTPAGVFIGVFSVDSAFERRMLVRTTWASHPRSRRGAGGGDDGTGTSRTLVRFIVGQPRKDWERRIKLEIEMYNDIVILPMPENMNGGKSHTFFSWASINAWVPPVYGQFEIPPRQFSYSNYTALPPSIAPHDPVQVWENIHSSKPRPWVRPDFVVKVDDDSFVMLAELESRLRVELHMKQKSHNNTTPHQEDISSKPGTHNTMHNITSLLPSPHPLLHVRQDVNDDPLIYWGYLVTNRLHQFMAGELYALSWSLVEWVAKDPMVKTLVRGAEDKQTSKWMRAHPRASEVRWTSEHCWIYDHPRSGTVYSHGFLFPSEAARIRRSMQAYLEKMTQPGVTTQIPATGGSLAPTPAAWAHSSVSTFGVRYTPPIPELTSTQSVEALVEGSDMSMIREGSPMTPEYAWTHREGRKTRYEGKRVGGTIVVHFIKKNMWYLETALALLEGEEFSEAEKYESQRAAQDAAHVAHLSRRRR